MMKWNLLKKREVQVMSKNRRPNPHPQMRPQSGQMQVRVDPSDVTQKVCEQCGHALFDLAYRYGIVSALSPNNPTGKDIPLKTEALICRACGWEFGKKMETKQ